jgi:hypothetical protein
MNLYPEDNGHKLQDLFIALLLSFDVKTKIKNTTQIKSIFKNYSSEIIF